MQYNYTNRQKFAKKLLNDAIGCKTKREVFNIFASEMLTNDHRYLSLSTNQAKYVFIRQRLLDWLQGLCSTVSIPFESHEIITQANAFGLNRDTDIKQGNFLEIYWQIMANELYHMLGIFISEYVSNN